MRKRLTASTYIMLLMSFLGLVTLLRSERVSGLSWAGPITTDTIWTHKESPIYVVGDVTIADGATLSIYPGVEVRFETGRSLTITDGRLDAAGNQTHPIWFTSGNSVPTVGDWEGIKFYGDEDSTLTLSFCVVKYATDGVTVASLGNAVIERSTFTNNSASGIQAIGAANLLVRENTIRLNSNGISTSGSTSSGLKVVGNDISNNENGVYTSVFGDDSRIHNITISGNSLRDNTNGIYFHSCSRPVSLASTFVHNVTIFNNSIQSSKYGIHLLARGWGEPGLIGGGAYIYNTIIRQNNIAFSEDAIYIDSSSNWYSWIYDLTVSGNVVRSNENGIFMHAFHTGVPPAHQDPFDVAFANNIVSANDVGVSIDGDLKVNFTSNAFSYNSLGIYLDSSVSTANIARNNDIYRNTAYGLYVVDEASIDADQNYWGASSGPCHETLNPDGEGDRVHGDEENLRLMFFLAEPYGAINDPPLAVIEADMTMVAANQTVIFDGSASSDDSSVIDYFFDFGDGEAVRAFPGVVRHAYASPGTYSVSLVVMDDLGVNSTNRAIVTIVVAEPSALIIAVFPNPLNVFSEGQAEVEVHVEAEVGGELVNIEGALVELASDAGGSFALSSGYTNSTGDFQSTFYAPRVEASILVGIVATSSKDGYQNGTADAILQVLLPSSDGTVLDPSLILFGGTFAIVVAVAVLVVLKRTGKLSGSRSSKRTGAKRKG